MKFKFLCLLAFAASTTAAHAQSPAPAPQPALSPGKYLLITADKNSIFVRNCEVTKEKEATFIKFSPPAAHPEYAQKPIPVLILSDRIQFSIGTGDYVEPQSQEHVVFGNSVYIGQLSQDEVHGTITEVQMFSETVTEHFCLHKL